MLRAIDIAFVIFHTALIIFNVAGWAVPVFRRANLVTLVLTGLSWFGLGIFYGFGYCPFTDWHFDVLRRLGETNLPRSYVEYLIERLFPVDVSPALVDTTLLIGFVLALAVSAMLNVRDNRPAVTKRAAVVPSPHGLRRHRGGRRARRDRGGARARASRAPHLPDNAEP